MSNEIKDRIRRIRAEEAAAERARQEEIITYNAYRDKIKQICKREVDSAGLRVGVYAWARNDICVYGVADLNISGELVRYSSLQRKDFANHLAESDDELVDWLREDIARALMRGVHGSRWRQDFDAEPSFWSTTAGGWVIAIIFLLGVLTACSILSSS